jgi:hypothetical protein
MLSPSRVTVPGELSSKMGPAHANLRRHALRAWAALVGVTVMVLALSSPSPALAKPQVKIIDTAPDIDALGGFTGSSLIGLVRNSGANDDTYDLILIDAAGNETKVNRPGTEGLNGGIDGTTVVYVEVTGNHRKLVLYDTQTASYTDLAFTPAGPGHPTISGPWILYKESASPSSSVWLYNRMTQESRRLAYSDGAQETLVYTGQVAGDWATWARVTQAGDTDIYITRISTGHTTRLRRPRGVYAEYNPAINRDGTVFYTRNTPCRPSRCRYDPPRSQSQLVEQRRGHRPRVVATLPTGLDTGYMYAQTKRSGTLVTYPRFVWLRGGDRTNADFYGFTTRR